MEADNRIVAVRNWVTGEVVSRDIDQNKKFSLGGITSVQLLYNVGYIQ